MTKDGENNNALRFAGNFPKKLPHPDTEEPEIVPPGFPVSRRTPAFNFIVYPFHHLISAARLASAETSLALSREDLRRSCWQILAAQGIPPAEAAFFDDSLNLHFIERTAGAPVEIEWEVLYFHDLQGCAELYRTELLVWKRLIHNADEALPAVVELDAKPIIEFPDLSIPLVKSRENYRLFLDNLTAPFDLAFSTKVSQTETSSRSTTNSRSRKKPSTPEYLSHFHSYGARRTKNWLVTGDSADAASPKNTSGKADTVSEVDQNRSRSGMIFHIRLTPYWNAWREASRNSRFDFDYLETIREARALRFYELTKLWRVLSMTAGFKGLPAKMEIEYQKFAALMPLPLLNGERKIKEQIARLIQPLKAGGYVKSFAIKANLHDLGGRRARLVFRFGD